MKTLTREEEGRKEGEDNVMERREAEEKEEGRRE